MFPCWAIPLDTIYKRACFSTDTVSNEVPVASSTVNRRPTLHLTDCLEILSWNKEKICYSKSGHPDWNLNKMIYHNMLHCGIYMEKFCGTFLSSNIFLTL